MQDRSEANKAAGIEDEPMLVIRLSQGATMGMIKLLAAPIRSIVRFPLFQLAIVVALILLLQAANDKSALGQIFNGLDIPWDCYQRYST
jgi:hypothetical protein